ncbi:hypothetical protein [Paenibacillus sp. OAE614]
MTKPETPIGEVTLYIIQGSPIFLKKESKERLPISFISNDSRKLNSLYNM